MGKLQTDRFERLAARVYSIKGPGALVDLDETVLGVLQLERQAGIEAHLIQGWRTFGVRTHVAAVAGQYSWVLLNNPVGSTRLIVVDGWQKGGTNPTDSMRIFMTRGVPPGFVPDQVAEGLDTRMSTATQPSARLFVDTTATGGFGTVVLEATYPDWRDYQVVLSPDGSMAFRTDLVNQNLGISIRFAERDAAPFELR